MDILPACTSVGWDMDWELNLDPVEGQSELFIPDTSISSNYVNL